MSATALKYHTVLGLLQGAKYKRRWVEVTADTMVYAPSQQDALTGHIQVFSIDDMVWVKPASDTKFLVSSTAALRAAQAAATQLSGLLQRQLITQPACSMHANWYSRK
jgi:hypothetical protein